MTSGFSGLTARGDVWIIILNPCYCTGNRRAFFLVSDGRCGTGTGIYSSLITPIIDQADPIDFRHKIQTQFVPKDLVVLYGFYINSGVYNFIYRHWPCCYRRVIKRLIKNTDSRNLVFTRFNGNGDVSRDITSGCHGNTVFSDWQDDVRSSTGICGNYICRVIYADTHSRYWFLRLRIDYSEICSAHIRS